MARTKSNGNASDWFRQNKYMRCFSLSASNHVPRSRELGYAVGVEPYLALGEPAAERKK